MKSYKIIPKIVLGVLLLLGIVATAMFFFFGGSEGSLEVAGDFLDIPFYTNIFLYWNYILVALVCVITLIVVIVEFIKLFAVNKKKAIISLLVVLCFAGLIVLCWYLGSPNEIQILGYEGTDNVGNMARMSDACMYLTYILVGLTVLALAVSIIRSICMKLSK